MKLENLLTLPTTLYLLAYAAALPSFRKQEPQQKPLPLLIWHGLGDRYDAEGLHSVGDLAIKINPDTYVYYIRLDEDGGQDRSATFLGNVTEQIEQVCEDLRGDKELQRAISAPSENKKGKGRVDALGFSQGGRFLRGLAQRCDAVQIRSLVTFGSQHNGIAEIKQCGTFDFVCKGALALIKGNAWTDYVQSRVVPAQYYRTVNESTGLPSKEYLEHSNFIADVNNERKVKNGTYAERLSKLDKFVMFLFANDTTVIPKESGWFAEVNATSGEVTPLKQRELYQEDWIGLKKLDEKGALVFKTHPGDHMQLEEEILAQTFREYFGADEPDRFHFQTGQLRDFEFRHSSMWPADARLWDRVVEWARDGNPIKEYL